jgi:hypothetical protein
MLEIGGGLRIVNAAKSSIFDEQMLEPGMKFSSPRLEAVYVIPADKPDVSVIVTNTTNLCRSMVMPRLLVRKDTTPSTACSARMKPQS